ncbi:Uma2 family endonuclease [Laspinema sp. A4]|uniref:Uma2 family endonuclease n=1 Tax=Laspinema sp. D2d TaxID=2953686 RepID=UPI0021BAE161|nr:Uma2 family endonuclease [Laspinema sp. D2d]MCT7986352.1 Uma2 family endonuclease [Laspinema sp. D2d]
MNEVLSPSTQTLNLGEKFTDYQKIDSLEEYILISQEIQEVECHHLTGPDTWETEVYGSGDRIVLKSLNLEFAIGELSLGLDP